ncbi:MAG: hypothetical protein LBS43_07675 [Prevotellaceae bacterium]|jgi:hypothetical protein|nr:hypothetical protein [Prevotellaceae bacterium]
MTSYLQNKAKDLVAAANLLHANKLYPAVAHSAYYCCVQLMKHIWLYSMRKTENDLMNELNRYNQIMKSREFIVKELENFIKQFPQTRVRYEHEKLTNAHFVEVVPYEVYNSDEKFFLWEYETLSKYSKIYPGEGLCFISDDDDSVGIENVELTLYGAEYVRKQKKKNKERVVELINE